MSTTAKPDMYDPLDIVPERLATRAERTDYYFRPDEWIEGLVSQVEEILERNVNSGGLLLSDIGRHMLFGYAKRLRPVFVLLAQHLYNDNFLKSTMESAAAAELIHCATLFHDDVIDDASTRKGRKSANSLWGNKSAVIVGDHFFVNAFQIIASLKDHRAMELFIDMCRAVAHGVLLEIQHTRHLGISKETHLEIIRNKTAVFFQTAAMVGGHLAGAGPEEEANLAGFGLNFGLAFQLSDDLLDIFSNPEATGKPRGADIRAGIYTIPIIHALSENEEFVRRFKPILAEGNVPEEKIIEIADFLKSNGTMAYTHKMVELYGEKALSYLDCLPKGRANDAYRDLLNKIVHRKYY